MAAYKELKNNMTNNITIKQYIEDPSVKTRIGELLKNKANQFVISLLSIVNTNEALAMCDPKSVLNAAMIAASLDLPINQNLGFSYLIPYKGVAQLQLGYKAFIQLAQRSGQFKTINASSVKQGEIVSIDRLTGEIVFNWIEDREKLPVIGYVGYMELNNGFKKTLYMTVSELRAHGMKFSQTMKKGYGLWKDEFEAMASKTVIKLLLAKYAPLTVDMQKAQLADQSIVKGEDEFEYVDNTPELATDIAKEKENKRLIKNIKASKTIKELETMKEFCIDEELAKVYEEKLIELSVTDVR